MCGVNSASAPEFFLHHCFIDKIWANWQEFGDSYMEAHFRRNNRRLIGSPRYYSRNFLDNTNMRRRGKAPQCVLYNDPQHPEYGRILDRLDQMSLRQLRRLRRHRFTPPTAAQMRRLGVGRRDRRRAQRIVRQLQPVNPIRGNRGNAVDRALGFPLNSVVRSSNRGKRMASRKENAMWDRWRRRHRRRYDTEFPEYLYANATYP